MADIPASTWSETDDSNNTAAPLGFPEGMAPSGINNGARAVMGAVKRWFNWTIPKTTGGTTTAYTLSYSVAPGALVDGMSHLVQFNAACGANPTLNVNSLGAKPLYYYTGLAWAQVTAAGTIPANFIGRVSYNSSEGSYRITSGSFSIGAALLAVANTFTGANTFSATLSMSAAAINEAIRVDVASATTCDIGAAASNYVRITGTTTITGLGTVASGVRRHVVFAAATPITHHSTSLILPTGTSITTAAGDTALFISEGSGNWRCASYQRATGRALKSNILQVVNTTLSTYSANAATIPIDNTKPQSSEGTQFFSEAFTPISASSTIVIDVTLVMGCTSAPDTAAIALFQDSGTDAIAANCCGVDGYGDPKTLRYQVASGSTSARTYKVRAGCNTNTLLINGVNGVGAVMNGLCQSRITITEYEA